MVLFTNPLDMITHAPLENGFWTDMITSFNQFYGRDKVFFLFITAGSVNIIFEPPRIPVRIEIDEKKRSSSVKKTLIIP